MGLLSFIIWCVVAAIQAGSYYSGNKRFHYTANQYLKAAGVPVYQDYPLQFGASLNSSATSSPRFTLLSGKAAVAEGLQPSPNVRLSLQMNERSYILEVPFNDVTFITKVGVRSSARFTIVNYEIGSIQKRYKYNAGRFFLLDPPTLKERQHTLWDTRIGKNIRQRGLPGFLLAVAQHFYITLTPKQQAQYLGGS